MRFYSSGYNIWLKAVRDEPIKPLSTLWLAKCDLDGEDVWSSRPAYLEARQDLSL